jgi:hypothetical protein
VARADARRGARAAAPRGVSLLEPDERREHDVQAHEREPS